MPHVRNTCPGVPWGVRGPKTTGEAHQSLLAPATAGLEVDHESPGRDDVVLTLLAQ